MVFTVKGTQCQLSREEVEGLMKEVDPAKGRHYFVTINGRKYPAMQVLYLSLRSQCEGLSQLDFSNALAKNILSQMGFEIIEEK
jgi:hypothetical protein